MAELGGHNAVIFEEQELLNMNEDAFEGKANKAVVFEEGSERESTSTARLSGSGGWCTLNRKMTTATGDLRTAVEGRPSWGSCELSTAIDKILSTLWCRYASSPPTGEKSGGTR